MVRANFNLLAQSFRDVLQRSLLSISAKVSQASEWAGKIDVHLYVSEGQTCIDFHDNGAGLAGPESGIETAVTTPLTPYVDVGLTVAKQIIFDHLGDLQIVHSDGTKDFVRIKLANS